jgi:hypothetical protein
LARDDGDVRDDRVPVYSPANAFVDMAFEIADAMFPVLSRLNLFWTVLRLVPIIDAALEPNAELYPDPLTACDPEARGVILKELDRGVLAPMRFVLTGSDTLVVTVDTLG